MIFDPLYTFQQEVCLRLNLTHKEMLDQLGDLVDECFGCGDSVEEAVIACLRYTIGGNFYLADGEL